MKQKPTLKKKKRRGGEVGFGSMHRPFMEQRSYFKAGLEIENKLDHARPLLKMICKDKWKRLERKLKKKKPNMKPPGHWDCKGKQGRGLEKERKGVTMRCQSTE